MAQNENSTAIEIKPTKSTYETMKYVLDFVKNLDKTKNYKLAILSRKRAPLIPYQIYFIKEKIDFYCPRDLQILLSPTFKELLDILMIKDKLNRLSELTSYEIKKDILSLINKVFNKSLSAGSKK